MLFTGQNRKKNLKNFYPRKSYNLTTYFLKLLEFELLKIIATCLYIFRNLILGYDFLRLFKNRILCLDLSFKRFIELSDISSKLSKAGQFDGQIFGLLKKSFLDFFEYLHEQILEFYEFAEYGYEYKLEFSELGEYEYGSRLRNLSQTQASYHYCS
ncbi:hypothetical protein BpHYR1_030829 [Brachionus plicatilis]|uniref:Uncharacterized protein n=1 Tax=Brachionus plicatilis TaxID=10195 RepID=A0A3M7RBD9_BRAPC|nr:hypothetical protein BpHYR1_030829 [Brachionus plicatilis]